MRNPKWTPKEDAILRAIWASQGTIESKLHLLPGRVLNAVFKRASKLKLEMRFRHPWTQADDEILREIWCSPGSIKSQMRRLPNHTPSSCQVRAAQLGLGLRDRSLYARSSWVERAVLIELSKASNLHIRHLAKVTGANEEHIRRVMNRLRGKGVRIAGWTHLTVAGSVWSPLWALGNEPDAPMPQKRSDSERSRAYRAARAAKTYVRSPFAVALGQVQPITASSTGRVYRQPMDIEEWGHSRKEAA
jgi:hypothetical protein